MEPIQQPAKVEPAPQLPQGRVQRPARERSSLQRRALLGAAGLAGVTVLTRLARAGELSPPPGPIAPTGASLGEVGGKISALDAKIGPFSTTVAEPRTPIASLPSSADAKFVISQPGAYCFTRNMKQEAGWACTIDIQSDHVDIDGQGFVFEGSGGGVVSCGIRSSGRQAIEIYDCAFKGWQGSCCYLLDCDDVHISDVLFHGCVSPPTRRVPPVRWLPAATAASSRTSLSACVRGAPPS